MWDFNNEEGRKWLPCELGDRSDRAQEGVLITGEFGVFLKTEQRTVTEYRLVQDLEEVDPDEDSEDNFVRLSSNAGVLSDMSVASLGNDGGVDNLHPR